MEWTMINIPVPVAQRIKKIIGLLGYANVSDFAREAIRIHLEKEEAQYEELKEVISVGKKTLGKED